MVNVFDVYEILLDLDEFLIMIDPEKENEAS
jgi:hypothetical protein